PIAEQADDRPLPRHASARRRAAGARDAEPRQRRGHQLAVPRAAHERHEPPEASPAEQGELLAVPEREGERARPGSEKGGVDDEGEAEREEPDADEEAEQR